MNTVTNVQLAKIHIACAELGINANRRGDMLYERFKKTSSRDLTSTQAAKLLSEFEQMGWKPKKAKKASVSGRLASEEGKKKYEHLGKRPGMATPPMLRKIEAMWAEVSRAADKKTALRSFLGRWGVDALEFLTFEQADNVIVALKRMKGRVNGADACQTGENA